LPGDLQQLPLSSWEDQPAAEVMKLTVGDLGDFHVSVFTDGFLVKALSDEEQLEISNIGSGVVSVTNSRPKGEGPAVSRTVMTNTHGEHLREKQIRTRHWREKYDEEGRGASPTPPSCCSGPF